MCFMNKAIELKKHPRLPILVSSDGKIFKNGRWLKLTVREDGYAVCNVDKKQYRVHRLVLEAFVGDCPPEMDDARHLKNDKLDNSIGNLAWGTRQQQIQDMKDAGTFSPPPIRRKKTNDATDTVCGTQADSQNQSSRGSIQIQSGQELDLGAKTCYLGIEETAL
jgi:hypothetical protein